MTYMRRRRILDDMNNADHPVLPTLMTQRLVLRPFSYADAERVRELAGDARVAETTATIPHPYEAGMAEEWVASLPALVVLERFTWAVSHQDHGLIGGAELRVEREHDRAEIGYWIGVPYWGSGYATETARALCRHAFDELGLRRVYAHHVLRNPASGRVLEKAGMRREAVLRQHVVVRGRVEDMVVWGTLRDDDGRAHTAPVNAAHLIWFVRDQAASTTFYARALALEPTLDVPGMTEFTLRDGTVLGLMPEAGAVRLLGAGMAEPGSARGVPRGELYLIVGDAAAAHACALAAGARELSPLQPRAWGDVAAYSLDPDGHVLVFAERP
jgi:RimJ/RimL family protein N-acetyltransferase/catechol 2,3-dioxygenase-like lactoylglutathione lyase family enzyme